MKRLTLLLILQTSAGSTTPPPPPEPEAPQLERATDEGDTQKPVLLASAAGLASMSDAYAGLLLGQFIDPYRPTFKKVTISGSPGSLTMTGPLTGFQYLTQGGTNTNTLAGPISDTWGSFPSIAAAAGYAATTTSNFEFICSGGSGTCNLGSNVSGSTVDIGSVAAPVTINSRQAVVGAPVDGGTTVNVYIEHGNVTCAASRCPVTFKNAFGSIPQCNCTQVTDGGCNLEGEASTTAVAFHAGTATAVVDWMCIGER